MTLRSTHRSNDAWLDALRGRGSTADRAVEELAAHLQRVVAKGTHGRLDAEARADVVQESIRRILERLSSFRGDSAFTTWATGVALHVAFTELRRQHMRSSRAGVLEAIERLTWGEPSRTPPAPDELLSRSHLHGVLEAAIATKLTDRQRVAIVAELRGVPTAEIAEHLGTNINALYKLTHDARRRLRAVLLEAGFTPESIHAHAKEAP
ncbi:MAG: RNA polymerase sigma factor [Myxococcales bacterium]|nr:RNA polymerase sigma factor [Myxococcales bacterium]